MLFIGVGVRPVPRQQRRVGALPPTPGGPAPTAIADAMSLSTLHARLAIRSGFVADRDQRAGPDARIASGLGSPSTGSTTTAPSTAIRCHTSPSRSPGTTTRAWPRRVGFGGRAVDHLGEVLDAGERVLHQSGDRDRQAEHAGASGHQTSRDRAGPIAEVVGHLADPLARLLGQPPLVVERVRNGRRGDPRCTGDVLDADRPGDVPSTSEHSRSSD